MTGSGLLTFPLLTKEIRTRMRSRMAVLLITLYVLGLSVSVMGYYLARDGLGAALGSAIGPGLFEMLGYILLWVVMAICPLVAASAVSGEHDQKTFESLAVAPVSLDRILGAKFLACAGYFFALLLLSLPVISICFIMGGVSPANVGLVLAALAGVVFFVTSVGIYCSTRFQRSMASIPVASACVLGAALLLSSHVRGWPILSLLSPLVFVPMAASGKSVPCYAGECPSIVVGLLLLGIGAIVLFRLSVVNMEFPGERRYVLFRCLVFAWFCAYLFFGTGASLTPSTECSAYLRKDHYSHLSEVLEWLLLLGSLLAPWMGSSQRVMMSDSVAGPSCPRGRVGRWFRSWMLEGWRFMLLLLGVGGICLWIGMVGVKLSAALCTEILLVYGVSLVLPILAFVLFAQALSGGGGTVRRWAGMSIAYIVTFCLVMGGPVAFQIQDTASEHGIPMAAQILMVMSPDVGPSWVRVSLSWQPIAPAIAAAMDPLVATAAFYGALALFSAVWLGIRAFRRRNPSGPSPGQGAPGATQNQEASRHFTRSDCFSTPLAWACRQAAALPVDGPARTPVGWQGGR